MCIKPYVHARVCGLTGHLDASAAESAPGVGGIGSAHVGRLLTLRGSLLRMGTPKMWEAQRCYQCNKCKERCDCNGTAPCVL